MLIKNLCAAIAAALILCFGTAGKNPSDAACFSMCGSLSDEVRAAEEKLTALGFFRKDADGYFDEELFQAVINFQSSKGMRKTGILSSGVLAALNIEEKNPLPEEDFILLCDFITAVCQNKSYISMACVASVVINRAGNPRFENGIASVIYSLNRNTYEAGSETPDYLCCRAAYEALRCGAVFPDLYYFTQEEAAQELFSDQKPVFSCDGLCFYS